MPLSFVVAADTHATAATGPWDGGDLREALAQALDQPVRPRFFTIVGDITQGATAADFDRVDEALRDITIPWIPVPGGHDWYEGGVEWRRRWGPSAYSFDVGHVHFVVWDTNAAEDEQLRFFAADLAYVDKTMVVVGLGHVSPSSRVADGLAALGVDYLFTGHWHANRRVVHDGLIEWGTQNLVMGTIDQSPSGYRVVTFAGDTPVVEHRARLVTPHLAVTAPHPGSCVPRDGFVLQVAAALDGTVPEVRARVDCGPEQRMAPAGVSGWSFRLDVGALAPGTHSLDVRAVARSGRAEETRLVFEVCDVDAPTVALDEWPQLGGSPAHAGASATTITPPLRQAWAANVGGHVLLGSPVVADGTVVVTTWDLGAGDRGGVVAFDAGTGRERWRHRTSSQARSAPAIADGVVVAVLATGQVVALALDDGALLWTHDAAAGLDRLAASAWGAPAIAEGVVYVTVQGRVSALDLATGAPRWTRDIANVAPWLGTLAAATVADGSVITTYGRDDGLSVWDAGTGLLRWDDTSARTVGIHATPVVHDGVLFIVSSSGVVSALDLATGARRWQRQVTPGSSEWMYSVTAAPVVAGDQLIVPTQWSDLVALDLATGAESWRVGTPGGPLNFTHYRATEPGFVASPVETGDVLWLARPDGMLVALAPADGRELWTTQLGAPAASAPAPAGDLLVVATFDGTVRGFVPGEPIVPGEAPACPPLPDEPPAVMEPAGCCDASGAPGGLAVATLAGLWLRRRSPRRRSAR